MSEVKVHPVQTANKRQSGYAPEVVTLKAYEVYCDICGPQKAMIEGDCRGGFSTAELIALLYARTFPKIEWDDRFNEAIHGMKDL